jgi:hypothetical protein
MCIAWRGLLAATFLFTGGACASVAPELAPPSDGEWAEGRAVAGEAPSEEARGGPVVPPPGTEARASVPAEPDEIDLQAPELERLQRTLFATGFLHRPPTGALDDPTRQALRAWQTAQGWEPTGALDRRSADRLLASPHGDVRQGVRPPGSDSTGGPPEGLDPSEGESGGDAAPNP